MLIRAALCSTLGCSIYIGTMARIRGDTGPGHRSGDLYISYTEYYHDPGWRVLAAAGARWEEGRQKKQIGAKKLLPHRDSLLFQPNISCNTNIYLCLSGLAWLAWCGLLNTRTVLFKSKICSEGRVGTGGDHAPLQCEPGRCVEGGGGAGAGHG